MPKPKILSEFYQEAISTSWGKLSSQAGPQNPLDTWIPLEASHAADACNRLATHSLSGLVFPNSAASMT
jgi:hypothetical protein